MMAFRPISNMFNISFVMGIFSIENQYIHSIYTRIAQQVHLLSVDFDDFVTIYLTF